MTTQKIRFFIAIVIIMIIPLVGFTQTNNLDKGNKVSTTQSELTSLKNELNKLKSDVDQKITNQNQTIQTSFSGTALNLASASHFITIAGVIVTVFVLLLGVYVNRIYSNITSLSNENKQLLETHMSVKKEVDKLNELINNNLMGLYSKIKEEETKNIISRLQKVPWDIANVSSALASRELSKEYYPMLKKCYLYLEEIESSRPRIPSVIAVVAFQQNYAQYRLSYLTLFFQHFADLALFDNQLATDMENQYISLMLRSFENDIRKTTSDIIRACIDNNLADQGDKLNKYFTALERSVHVYDDGLYQLCYDSLIDKQTRLMFYSLLNAGVTAKYKLAKLILSSYKNDINTESEGLALAEMERLIREADGASGQSTPTVPPTPSSS